MSLKSFLSKIEFSWNTLYLQNWFSYLVLQSILASEQAQLMILNHKKIKIGNDFITGSRVYKVCYGLVINLYIFKITDAEISRAIYVRQITFYVKSPDEKLNSREICLNRIL